MSMDNYAFTTSAPTDNLRYDWRRPFGIMIQEARESSGRSVDEAARLAGMEPSEWAALEDGNIVVDPVWVRPMADALGICVDQIETMIHFSQFAW